MRRVKVICGAKTSSPPRGRCVTPQTIISAFAWWNVKQRPDGDQQHGDNDADAKKEPANKRADFRLCFDVQREWDKQH
jgi:hypothetical protein